METSYNQKGQNNNNHYSDLYPYKQVDPVMEPKEEQCAEGPPCSQRRGKGPSRRSNRFTRFNEAMKPPAVVTAIQKNMNEPAPSAAPDVPKKEEATETKVTPSKSPAPPLPATVYQTCAGQYFALTQGGSIQFANEANEGMASLSMASSPAPQAGATIVQYITKPGDDTQRFYMQRKKMMVQAATGDMSAYQIRSPTSSLPQGVMTAGSPDGSMHSPQQMGEEASRKRELRLMKNRKAAKECRRRKREYIHCLETRLSALEALNEKLKEELAHLKGTHGPRPKLV